MQQRDIGTYICTARNSEGFSEESVDVDIVKRMYHLHIFFSDLHEVTDLII